MSPPATGLTLLMLCLLSLSAVGACKFNQGKGEWLRSVGLLAAGDEFPVWVASIVIMLFISLGLVWLAGWSLWLFLSHVLTPNTASQKRSPRIAWRAPAPLLVVVFCLTMLSEVGKLASAETCVAGRYCNSESLNGKNICADSPAGFYCPG